MIYDIYQDSLTATSGSNLQNKQDAKTIEKSYELIREKLGGRIKVFVCGGAALRPEVKQFLVRCWNTPMIDGYGSTETGNIAIGGRILPGVRVKLSPVTDPDGVRLYDGDEGKQILKRGECRVKTKSMFLGYFNNKAKTDAARDKDGWFRMGDVVERDKAGGIKVIGRCKNVIKLSNAKWVNPEVLENTYHHSPFVHQIFIHGTNNSPYVCAIVVPDREHLKTWGKSHGHHKLNYVALCKLRAAEDAVKSDFARIAAELKLPCYKHLRHLKLDSTGFSEDNFLLTSSLKLARPSLKLHFAQELAALQGKAPKSVCIDGQDALGTVVTTTCDILDIMDASSVTKDSTFCRLGLNSLGATRLRFRLERQLGVVIDKFTLGSTIEGKITVGALSSGIEQQQKVQSQLESKVAEILGRPSVDRRTQLRDLGCESMALATLHQMMKARFDLPKSLTLQSLMRDTATSIVELAHHICSEGAEHHRYFAQKEELRMIAEDSVLGTEIRVEDLSSSKLPRRVSGYAVFLTGVTGFLGPFIAKEVIANLNRCSIYCLVRVSSEGQSAKAAQLQVEKAFAKCGLTVPTNVVAIIGDLTKPRLG